MSRGRASRFRRLDIRDKWSRGFHVLSSPQIGYLSTAGLDGCRPRAAGPPAAGALVLKIQAGFNHESPRDHRWSALTRTCLARARRRRVNALRSTRATLNEQCWAPRPACPPAAGSEPTGGTPVPLETDSRRSEGRRSSPLRWGEASVSKAGAALRRGVDVRPWTLGPWTSRLGGGMGVSPRAGSEPTGGSPVPRQTGSGGWPTRHAHSGGFCRCGLSTPMQGRLR